MKNKLAAFIVALMLPFSLVACGGSEQPASPAVTVTAEPTPEAPVVPEQSTEEVFVEVIKDNTNAFDNVPADALVSLAETMCGAWEEGASFEQLAQIMLEEGFEAGDSGFFIGAGTQAFCPEHVDKITGGTNA